MESIAFGLGALFGAASVLYLCYLYGNLQAGPWLTKRGQARRWAEENGFQCEGDGILRKTLHGLPLTIQFLVRRGSKSSSFHIVGCLGLPGCPKSLTLYEEGLFSGVARMFGGKELCLGDPEFDAVFDITADSVEEAQAYLTPARRRGLLESLPLLPGSRLYQSQIESDKMLSFPFGVPAQLRKMTARFETVAAHLTSTEATPLSGSSGVVERKLRKFALTSLLFWLPLALLSFTQSSFENWTVEAIMVLGAALTLANLTSLQSARVVLQGFYLFLAVLAALTLAFGALEFSELLPTRYLRIDEDSAAGFFLFGIVLLFLFASSRNYLKALDRTRVLVTESSESARSL